MGTKPKAKAAPIDPPKGKATLTLPNRDATDAPAGSPSRRSEPHIKEIGGSGIALWDEKLLVRTMQTLRPPTLRGGETAEQHQQEVAGCAGVAIAAFKPRDAVEAMIASQAVTLHHASLECARRAMLPEQSPDVSSRLRKDAANSARAMVDMCEALNRLRGKGGQQRIVVERVQVAPGGQAIVGTVTAGTPLPSSRPAPQAIGQDAPQMAMLDVEAVKAGVGMGE